MWAVLGLQQRIPRKSVLRSSRNDHSLLASTSFRDDSYLRTDILRRGSTPSSVQPEIDLPTLSVSELEALSRGGTCSEAGEIRDSWGRSGGGRCQSTCGYCI
jgi:hypothetical protein